MLDVKLPRSFAIGGAEEGILYKILEMNSTELVHTCNAF